MNNDTELRHQVFDHLNQKETDELINIWQANDRYSWTDMAYEEMEKILRERLTELPPQNEPSYDEPVESESEEGETDLVFYKPGEVLNMDIWINRAAFANVALIILTNITQFSNFRLTVFAYFGNNIEWEMVSWVLAFVLIVVITTIECLVGYFPLKALGSILRILMEMEFNSRGEKFVTE